MKISLLLLILSLFASASTSEIKIIAFDMPPYMVSTQEDKGMIPLLLTEAMKKVGLKPNFAFYPVKRALKEFLKGDALILTTFRVLPPGLVNHQMLGLTKVVAGLYALKNRTNIETVAYERGLQRIKRLIQSKGLKPVPVASYKAGLQMLKSQRVHAFHGVELTVNYNLGHGWDKFKNNFVMAGDPHYTDLAGLIGRPKHEEVIQKVLKGVKILRESGVDQKILGPSLTKYSKGNHELYMQKEYSIIKSNTKSK